MKYTSLIAFFILITFACVSKKVPKVKNQQSIYGLKKRELSNYEKRDSLLKKYNNLLKFKTFDKLVNGDYSLEIETEFLNDTLVIDNVIDSLYSTPIISKQKLIFKKNNAILRELFPMIKQIVARNKNGKKILMLDASIYSISVYSGNRDLFSVKGCGILNGEIPEFFGLYTMEGKVLYDGYSNKGAFKNSYRDLKVVLKNYGITQDIFREGESQSKQIDGFWVNK
jgi:hypothetical protein